MRSASGRALRRRRRPFRVQVRCLSLARMHPPLSHTSQMCTRTRLSVTVAPSPSSWSFRSRALAAVSLPFRRARTFPPLAVLVTILRLSERLLGPAIAAPLRYSFVVAFVRIVVFVRCVFVPVSSFSCVASSFGVAFVVFRSFRISGVQEQWWVLPCAFWLPTIRVHGRHRSLYVAVRTGWWLYSAPSSVGVDTRVASARIACSVFCLYSYTT